MKIKYATIWMIVAIVMAAIVTSYTLYQLLFSPLVVHELGGDAMKNYFAYIYHCMYGSGFWFDGMNYPYGEQIMFVDGQPLLTVTISYLRNWIVFTPEQLNTILNSSMSLAFFLAIVYLYKVLLKFGVGHVWAIAFACVIVPMSMQLFLLCGMYGLAYSYVMPMYFYWFICYYETSKRKYILYTFVLTIIVMLLHPYQLAFITVWSGLYMAAYFVITRSKTIRQRMYHLIPIILSVSLSVGLFKLILLLTDTASDRPTYPYGLLSYGTTGAHIFKLQHSPYWQFLERMGWAGEIPQDMKGYAYTGVVAIAILCSYILVRLYLLVRRKKMSFISNIDKQVAPVWQLVGLGALLFSMGVPFVWGLDFLYDYVSVFRQFRNLGNFAILFYYVATSLAVVVMYRSYIYVQKGRRLLAVITLFILPLMVWSYEATGIINHFRERGYGFIYNYYHFYSKLEHKKWKTVLEEQGYKPSDFQAIIHMPYCHVGSEKIWLSRGGFGLSLAMEAAFQLKLPIVDASMSRSSWSRTFEHIPLGGGAYTEKKLLYGTNDKRPFLLMYYEFDKLDMDDRYLFDISDSLCNTTNMITHILYPDTVRNTDIKNRNRMLAVGETIGVKDSSLKNTDYYYNHFDTGQNTTSFCGNTAMQPVMDKEIILDKIDVHDWQKGVDYEASFWTLVNEYDYKTPSVFVEQFDDNGKSLNKIFVPASQSRDVHEMWFRAGGHFSLDTQTITVVLGLDGKNMLYHSLDEVLVRQATDTVIYKDKEGKVMANNHLMSNDE